MTGWLIQTFYIFLAFYSTYSIKSDNSTKTSTSCSVDQFQCSDGKCIPLTAKCNGIKDCLLDDDEIDCTGACQDGFFRCGSKECIHASWVCDFHADCQDKSDEMNCGKNSQPQELECPPNQWRCPNAWCIPETWVCDGDSNCLDGEDEAQDLCTKRTTEKPKACSGEQFECAPGECIMHRWICDGHPDCSNGNDEGEQCGTYRDPCLMEEGYFSCGNSTDHKCISHEFVCDGVPQCPNKVDEGGKCSTDCSTIKCSHNCTSTPMGPKCFCPPGFTLADNGLDCIDMDECKVYGTCSQTCVNTPGSYSCSCLDGYQLVNGTCYASGVDPIMFVSTKDSIRSYNLRTKTGNRIINFLEHVIGVSYDALEDRVYWTDVKMKQEMIESISTKGITGGRKVHLSSGLDVPEDIVIDQASRNLYFSDSGKGHIAVCDMSGTTCKVLIKKTEQSKPRALAIHDRKKLLFYSDWGEKPMIVSVGLDGTDRKEIITTDLVWPNGVAVDQVEDRVFWSDAKLDRLESSNLDGSDRVEVLKDLLTLHPFSLAVFEDTLYWSDWTGDMLASCNKYSGKDKKVLVRESNLYIMGITVYHPLMNEGVFDPCAGHPCSHLCLPSPTSRSGGPQFSCVCPDNMKLRQDGVTCHEPHLDSLVISAEVTFSSGKKNGRIYRVEPHAIGNTGFNLIRGVRGEIKRMKGDLTNGNILAKTDNGVFEVNVHNQRTKLLSTEADMPFTYDAINKNLYWIDYARRSIRVQSVRTKSSKPVVENLSNPKLLAYCDLSQKLVYLDGVRLEQVDPDGRSNKTTLYDHVDPSVNILYYAYQNNSLVLGNTMKNSIYVYDLNTRMMTHLVYGIQKLFDLVVHNGYLYWTQSFSSELFWLKFEKGVNMKDLRWMSISDVVGQYDAVKVSVSTNKTNLLKSIPRPCEEGQCSHLCFSKNFKAECGCEYGHVLEDDGETCKAGCAADLFSCGDTERVEMCLDKSLVCDGNKDCTNGLDEANCTKVCDLNTHYLCADGECLVGTNHKCDFETDCSDGSDEEDCPALKCDKEGQFMCNDKKKCILSMFKCDSHNDCFDGSDELNCTYSCNGGFFSCPTGIGCYKESWKCDGHRDCPGGEDELDCPAVITCPENMFTCDDGNNCIDYSMVCDRQADCEDGSDELASRCPPKFIEEPVCNDGFVCDELCLPITAMCNGTSECTDDFDETDCLNLCTDTKNFFQCRDNKKCITKNWMCDGERDCMDGSDEQECGEIDLDIDTRCHPHQYRCSNGECLNLEFVCDGYKHCADGSDEDEKKCKVCEKNNGDCTQKCHPTPQGASCSCHSGYNEVWESTQLSCVDIDECAIPSSCPQLCTNTKGSYKCTCSPGFISESQGEYCRADGENMKLLFLNQYVLKAVLPHKKEHLLSEFSGRVHTIAVNQQDQEIFASIPSQGVIMKVKIDGLMTNTPKRNDSKTIIPYMVNVGRVTSMAFDWVTKNLYFVCKDANKVHVCSSKLFCTELLEVKNNIISGLEIDPLAGRLFIASYSESFLGGRQDGEVLTYSLDGKVVPGISHRISGDKLSQPVGLTVDIHKKTVMWIDKMTNIVYSSDYNGKNVALVAMLTSYQTSLTNFENTLFWINPKEKKISSYNLKVQNSKDTHIQNVPEHSHSILALQEQMQPQIVNPCSRSKCSHLCLLSAVKDFTCACPTGFKLSSTNSSNCLLQRQKLSPTVLPSETAKSSDGPKKVMLAPYKSNGLVAGVIIVILVIILVIGLAVYWFKFRNNKKLVDVIAFTNSSYNNNESQITEKERESQVVMRRGAILSCDNPMFVDSPQNTPGSARFGFLKFGSNTHEPTMSASPSMDFSNIVSVTKGGASGTNTPKQSKNNKQRMVSESMSYDDAEFYFDNDKKKLIG